jgi:LPS sulfotransferase NodH
MIPFIVIGHPRSGSTLLKEAIDQHLALKIYGELFHQDENERKNTHFIKKINNEKVYYKGGNEDALNFLFAHIWGDDNSAYHAVGFKLFAERIQCIGADKLFLRLKNVPNIHVVHIIRENYFDMWVSRKKAEQSGVWRMSVSDEAPISKREIQPIHADPENLMHYFNQLNNNNTFFQRHFKDVPYHAVYYNVLVGKFQEQMDIVYRFLNVKPMICKMTLKKQNINPHQQFILNYDELAAFFKTTQYGLFFNK